MKAPIRHLETISIVALAGLLAACDSSTTTMPSPGLSSGPPSVSLQLSQAVVDEHQEIEVSAVSSASPTQQSVAFSLVLDDPSLATILEGETPGTWRVATHEVSADVDATLSVSMTTSGVTATANATFTIRNFDRQPLVEDFQIPGFDYVVSTDGTPFGNLTAPGTHSATPWALVARPGIDPPVRFEVFDLDPQAGISLSYQADAPNIADLDHLELSAFTNVTTGLSSHYQLLAADPEGGRVGYLGRPGFSSDLVFSGADTVSYSGNSGTGGAPLCSVEPVAPKSQLSVGLFTEVVDLLVADRAGNAGLLGIPSDQLGTHVQVQTIAPIDIQPALDFCNIATDPVDQSNMFIYDRASDRLGVFELVDGAVDWIVELTPLEEATRADRQWARLVGMKTGITPDLMPFVALLFTDDVHDGRHWIEVAELSTVGDPALAFGPAFELPNGVPFDFSIGEANIRTSSLGEYVNPGSDIVIAAPETPYIYVANSVSSNNGPAFELGFIEVGYGITDIGLVGAGSENAASLVATDDQKLYYWPPR